MITFREIASLAKHGQLRNCRFIPGDSSNVPINVDETGIAYFDHPQSAGGRILLSDVSKDEADRIERENDYYSLPVWEEITSEYRKEREEIEKQASKAGRIE